MARPRKLSKDERVVLTQNVVEQLFPMVRELEEREGIDRCSALRALEDACRAMHLTVHRHEMERRAAAPMN